MLFSQYSSFKTKFDFLYLLFYNAIEGDNMITKLHFFKSHSLNPYENLAIEKYLFDTLQENTFTLYLWQNENTVVIGKNQNAWQECNCTLLEKEGGFLARRMSGGGAVFHDTGNLNFTFLCHTQDYDLNKHMQIIKKARNLAGISAEVSGRNDILVNGRKFSGNAFYNSKGKSYHHGTILINSDAKKVGRYLTPNKEKLQSKGIKSVRSRIINLTEIAPSLTVEIMCDYIIKATELTYSLKCVRLESPPGSHIANLSKSYSDWSYIYGSTLPFTASCKGSFEWGSVQLKLEINEGIIEGVQVFTDCMDWTLSEKLTTALTNCKLTYKCIQEKLDRFLPIEFCEDILSLLVKNLL